MSDFISHLRTVHLLIIVVCAAVFTFQEGEAHARYSQAGRELSELRKSLAAVHPNWFMEYEGTLDIGSTTRGSKEQFIVNKRPIKDIGLLYAPNPIGKRMIPQEWQFSHVYRGRSILPELLGLEGRFQGTRFDEDRSAVERGSIKDFATFWDTMNEVPVYQINYVSEFAAIEGEKLIDFEVDGPKALGAKSTREQRLAFFELKPADLYEITADVELSTANPQGGMQITLLPDLRQNPRVNEMDFLNPVVQGEWYLEGTVTPPGKKRTAVLISVSTRRDDSLPLLRYFLERSNSKLPITSFAQAFPQLQSMSDRFGGLTMEDIDRVINSLKEGAATEVEIVGLKFPENLAVLAVISLLLLFTSYLASNASALLAIRQGVSATDRLQWVGIHPSPLTRMCAYLSYAVLPFGVVLWLVASRWAESGFFPRLVMGAAVLFIAIQAVVLLRLISAFAASPEPSQLASPSPPNGGA